MGGGLGSRSVSGKGVIRPSGASLTRSRLIGHYHRLRGIGKPTSKGNSIIRGTQLLRCAAMALALKATLHDGFGVPKRLGYHKQRVFGIIHDLLIELFQRHRLCSKISH
jgi:hypothetical protein